MGESAEELRNQIDRTRDHMTTTVEAIEDRVMPSRIMERRRNRMSDAFGSFRDRVMGVPRRAAEAMPFTGHGNDHDTSPGFRGDLGSRSGSEPGMMERIEDQAESNPFAAGVIAFGAGMLVASLMPPSSAERQVASRAREAMEPLSEPLQEAAHEVLDSAKEHGREAMEAVKEAGSSGGQAVMDTAKDRAQQVREQAPSGSSGA